MQKWWATALLIAAVVLFAGAWKAERGNVLLSFFIAAGAAIVTSVVLFTSMPWKFAWMGYFVLAMVSAWGFAVWREHPL